MTDQPVALISAGASGIGLACAQSTGRGGSSGAPSMLMPMRSRDFRMNSARVGSGLRRGRCGAGRSAFHSADPTSALIFCSIAGHCGPQQPVEDIEVAAWQSTIDTDLNSVFYLTRLVIPLMKSRRSGLILNMSSSAGRYGCPMRSPTWLPNGRRLGSPRPGRWSWAPGISE